jgi:hypothetical protein
MKASECHVMSKRESFLLRMDPRVLERIRQWADDELRSVNGQIEYLLRVSLTKAGRWPDASDAPDKQADVAPRP